MLGVFLMNKIRKNLTAGIFIVLFLTFVDVTIYSESKGKEDTEKEARAAKLLTINEIGKLHQEVFLKSLEADQRISSKDKEIYSRFATQESLLKALIPVYAEHLSEEEIDAMITFYSTPLGKSIIAKQLGILKASSKALLSWHMEIAAKVKSEKARIAAAEKTGSH